jgi:hypothetical protein
MSYFNYAKSFGVFFLVFTYSFSSYEATAQSDTLVISKLDSLIKLSNKQIKLLNPVNSEEYKRLESELEKVEVQRNDFKSEKIKLESKLKVQSENNSAFASALADTRLNASQVAAINSWSQSQKMEIPDILALSIQISKRLDEIDLGLTKAPDTLTLNTLVRNLNFIKQKKGGINQKSFLVKEIERYVISIPQYFKCLQEFEKLCDGITESIVKSTVIDIMSVYKFDLASYPFLRGAFYYSVDYPNSMPYRQDFLWFLDHQVQIPNVK